MIFILLKVMYFYLYVWNLFWKKVNSQGKKYEDIWCSYRETILHKYFHIFHMQGFTEQRLLTTYVKDDWRENKPLNLNIDTFWEIYRPSSLEPFVYIPGVVNLETFSFMEYLFIFLTKHQFLFISREVDVPAPYISSQFYNIDVTLLWNTSCNTYSILLTSAFIPSPCGDLEHGN